MTNPDIRTLHRFVPRSKYLTDFIRMPKTAKTALYIDVETTGLDPVTDRIIQLAAVQFLFDSDDRVIEIGEAHSWYNDPGTPISPAITKLTGITDADVYAKSIDLGTLTRLSRESVLIVAHNADFDRRFLERLAPQFAQTLWACSCVEIDWDAFGCRCAKLWHIIEATCGEFYEPHQAAADCLAGIHVLATAQLDGRPALSYLLESARQPTMRVWANRSPFSTKDLLKNRGYHWHAQRKTWWIDVKASALAAEEEWLRAEVQAIPSNTKLTARERYSVRSDE